MLISQISATLLSLRKIASLWERARLDWLSFPPLQDCQGRNKKKLFNHFHLLEYFSSLIKRLLYLKAYICADAVLWTKSTPKGASFHKGMEIKMNPCVQNPGPPSPSSPHNPGQEWWSPDYSPPFPSHPTWGPGIPIAWSPALVHAIPPCSHTLN